MDPAGTDPLDDVFTIEDRFYTRGYNQGLQDGLVAGRTEGRSLGMQKGYEKFLESSRLAARAAVWANRMPSGPSPQSSVPGPSRTADSDGGCRLPAMPTANPRLAKNLTSLYALVEPGTLSTRNEDEAVQDFDDRLRRAQGKMKIVERMIGGSAKAEPTGAAPTS